MPKFYVQLPCIEHFLVDADDAEQAVEKITTDDNAEPYDITWIGEAIVGKVEIQ
jgi:hypothetical protein